MRRFLILSLVLLSLAAAAPIAAAPAMTCAVSTNCL
jgi:hypothetical protein